jgi:sodium-dependent dicarboxylate transporter 2/3/5
MPDESHHRRTIQWIGFALGPLLAMAALAVLPSFYATGTQPAEAEFTWAGRATLAVMLWMAVWWLTEAIQIAETALLPLVLFPLLGVATMKDTAYPYADHLIFLYFGGYVLALSMDRWGLGKRIALHTLKFVGTSARRMIAGFMLVTAVLSAFVSNTATTAMMLPIAMSTIALLRSQSTPDDKNQKQIGAFGTCLLLAIAYSASVGGVATIIGTPTNAFLIGFLRDSIAPEYRTDISFIGWLPIGVSLVFVFLPVLYVMLTHVLFPIQKIELKGGKAMVQSEIGALGRVQLGEYNTLFVFVCTVGLWLGRPWITAIEISFSGSTLQPLAGLTDTGIAMGAAMALFLLPVNLRQREFTMDWKGVSKIPWDVLILFGGGLSLAAAVQANGVAEFIGSYAGQLRNAPPIITITLITTAIVFITELTSNVATTMSLVPVLAAIAPAVGVHPYLLAIPATIAASCAFMLPVATPPNAIVFGTGEITILQMVRTGLILNLISIIIVTLLTVLVIGPWLEIPR